MKMARAALGRPYGWILLIVAIVMALAMAASYLGAFLDPEGHAHNMPIAIVNEDAGITVAGQKVNKGADVLKAIIAPNPQLGDTVKWTVLPSRAALVDRMKNNDYYAGIVIPADFTQKLAALSAPGQTPLQPATIETFSNPASGTFASSQSDKITAAAVSQVATQTRDQLIAGATKAQQPIPAAAAPVLANPVQAQQTVVVDMGTHNGHGLAPLYFAVVLTLGGFIGADIVSLGTDFLTGEGALGGAIARIRGEPYTDAGPLAIWTAKLVLTVIMSIAAGLLSSWLAIGLLHMHAPAPWQITLFATLGVLVTALLTLLLLTAFGTVGLLFGVLFTTILGVPSSGGVFPLTMVPGFYKVLATFIPMRYLTDGLRSLMFFDGRGAAGLTTALWVLIAWGIGSVLLSAFIAWVKDPATRAERVPEASLA